MLHAAGKAALSGRLVAIVSEIAKRDPGFGALVASLPLVSLPGMIWLRHDRSDAGNGAGHAGATFRYVLPSLPMFLPIPAPLRRGAGFWPAPIAGCAVTVALYVTIVWAAPRLGVRL